MHIIFCKNKWPKVADKVECVFSFAYFCTHGRNKELKGTDFVKTM